MCLFQKVFLTNGDGVYVWLENTLFSMTVQIYSLAENMNHIEGNVEFLIVYQ